MSLEYCPNCKIHVFAELIYCDTDAYIWKCPICKKKITIQYLDIKSLKSLKIIT
jgi:hypothetical protein